MAAGYLDPNTRNNDIGLYTSRSRRAVIGTPFGEIASWIKVTTAGTVVWRNSTNGEVGVWIFEAGEGWPLVCDEILAGATIDGTPETTTAAGIFWASTASNVGEL